MTRARGNDRQPTTDLVGSRRHLDGQPDFDELDPTDEGIPHVGDPTEAAARWRDLGSPVAQALVEELAGTSVAVVLADHEGRVLDRRAPQSATLAAMDARSIDVGYSLAESHVGTNGVGTSLETQRPTLVVGNEHFRTTFQSFACAHSPVLNPITGSIEGTIGVVCPVDEANPLLLPTARRLASELSSRQAEHSTPTERFLLQQFLDARQSGGQAIATIGSGVFIGTSEARRLLSGADHDELWAQIETIARNRSDGVRTLDWDDAVGRLLRISFLPAYHGGELGGATLDIRHATTTRPRRRPTRKPLALPGLVGTSAAWRSVVRDAHQASRTDDPLLIVGPRGSGRLSVAHAIADLHRHREVAVVDATMAVAEGSQDWLRTLQQSLRTNATVILRRIDALPNDVANASASIIAAAPPSARIIATSADIARVAEGTASLIDQVQVLRVDIAPLRTRREDIAVLTRHLAPAIGAGQIEPSVINALHRQPWPGNVTELRQTLRAAFVQARGGTVTVDHLPERIRTKSARVPLHGLQQHEADAIIDALARSANRTEAARMLGISRATLYRRIAAYGLDED